mgnify:CR=1 FL=1
MPEPQPKSPVDASHEDASPERRLFDTLQTRFDEVASRIELGEGGEVVVVELFPPNSNRQSETEITLGKGRHKDYVHHVSRPSHSDKAPGFNAYLEDEGGKIKLSMVEGFDNRDGGPEDANSILAALNSVTGGQVNAIVLFPEPGAELEQPQ